MDKCVKRCPSLHVSLGLSRHINCAHGWFCVHGSMIDLLQECWSVNHTRNKVLESFRVEGTQSFVRTEGGRGTLPQVLSYCGAVPVEFPKEPQGLIGFVVLLQWPFYLCVLSITQFMASILSKDCWHFTIRRSCDAMNLQLMILLLFDSVLTSILAYKVNLTSKLKLVHQKPSSSHFGGAKRSVGAVTSLVHMLPQCACILAKIGLHGPSTHV